MYTLLIISKAISGIIFTASLALVGGISYTKKQRSRFKLLRKLDGKQIHFTFVAVISLVLFFTLDGIFDYIGITQANNAIASVTDSDSNDSQTIKITPSPESSPVAPSLTPEYSRETFTPEPLPTGSPIPSISPSLVDSSRSGDIPPEYAIAFTQTCVLSERWRGYLNGALSPINETCWTMHSDWGFSEKDGYILIKEQLTSYKILSGLFLRLEENVHISLRLRISEMELNDDEEKLNINFGVISNGDIKPPASGLFIQREGETLPISLKWKSSETTDHAQEVYYRDEEDYLISYDLDSDLYLLFHIEGNEMTIMYSFTEEDPYSILNPTVKIVDTNRIFWIGFDISEGESLRTEIHDLGISILTDTE